MKVRKATTADIPKIVEMGNKFFEQTRHGEHIAYSPEAVSTMTDTMIDNPAAAVFVAETEAGEVVGGCAGLLFPLWMAPEHTTGQEMFWYVEPEHRKSRAGKLMFEALEEWAKEAGANSFSMVALSHMHENRVGQIYESKGYSPFERSYIKVF